MRKNDKISRSYANTVSLIYQNHNSFNSFSIDVFRHKGSVKGHVLIYIHCVIY